jgi:hypothetical protein
MEARAVAIGFVTTPEFTTPASIAKNDIATNATADAIAILVCPDQSPERGDARVREGQRTLQARVVDRARDERMRLNMAIPAGIEPATLRVEI